MTSPDAPAAIDVDAIVEEIRVRAAHARETGGYRPEILDIPFTTLSAESYTIRLRPEVAYSSKKVIGPAITTAKQTLIKGLRHVLDDAFDQTNSAVSGLRDEISESESDVARLEQRLDTLALRVTELADVVERLTRLVTPMAEAHIDDRLLALERTERAPAVLADVRPVDPRIIALSRDDASLRPSRDERGAHYAAILSSGSQVVELGARGPEFSRAALRAGHRVTSVTDDGMLRAHLDETGVETVLAAPLAYLAEADPASIDAVVAVDLGDRLPPDAWPHFADLLGTRVRAGGTVIIEIVDPTTDAGRDLRLRDPFAAPAVHPDTLAWILSTAAPFDVETQAFGSVTGTEGTALVALIATRRPAG